MLFRILSPVFGGRIQFLNNKNNVFHDLSNTLFLYLKN